MSKYFMILIVFSVIAVGAVLTVLVVSNQSLSSQPTVTPVATKTPTTSLSTGMSNSNINSDLKNTKIDESDSDLAPTEKNIKSL